MGGGVGMGGGMFFGVLLLGLVHLLVIGVWAVLGGVQRGGSGSTSRSQRGFEPEARRLLDERYARGEITTDEYQERLRVLGQRN